MAKPLQERIASALSTDRVTITTLETLIPEAEAERDRLSAAHVRASSDSVDFALSEDDREDAARKAERYSRNATAVGKAIEQLSAKLEAKRESDGRKAVEAECAAALAERDALADRFKKLVPDVVGQLIDLFSAIQRNSDRMQAAGVRERDAEAEARDVPGNWRIGPLNVDRFAQMKIPNLTGAGRCWPAEQRINLDLGREQYLANLQRGREERAKWKRHIVTPPAEAAQPITIKTQFGASSVHRERVIAWMCPEYAEEARGLGCTVEIAAPNVSIGLPSTSSF